MTLIVEVNPQLKGQQLGGPSGHNKPLLKQWAVNEAIRLFTMRNDEKSLQIINSITKKDDLADTVVQIEALFSLWNLPITKPRPIVRFTIIPQK